MEFPEFFFNVKDLTVVCSSHIECVYLPLNRLKVYSTFAGKLE